MIASTNLTVAPTFGRFVFNHSRAVLTRDHHSMELSASALALLAQLLKRPGQTIPHQQLAGSPTERTGKAASEATRTLSHTGCGFIK